MLVDLGADPYTIDKVIAGFGMPMGPFRCASQLPTCLCPPLRHSHALESANQRCSWPSDLRRNALSELRAL